MKSMDPSLETNADEAVNFLEAMCGDYWDLVAIHPDGKLVAKSFKKVHLQAAKAWIKKMNMEYNIYFHVNALKASARNKKATKADIACVCNLHVDIDDLGGLTRLQNFPVEPTAIVCSGNGYHAYWKLVLPSSQFDLCEAINRVLAKALGGDVSATDVSRILRVPGTINHPNKTKLAKGRVPKMAYSVKQ